MAKGERRRQRFAVGARVRVKSPGLGGVVTRVDDEATALGEYWHAIQTKHGERSEPGCNLELIPPPVTNSRPEVIRATASLASNDREFALLAIEEARKSVPERDGRTHPKVGAVVVKDHQVIGSAHRGEVSGCHAEYIVLERKLPEDSLVDATVYTTLEPCTERNHPKVPCANRIVERKVKRVVIGMLDPNPVISGRGQRTLRGANIITDFFPHDLMSAVEELNRDFSREYRTTAALVAQNESGGHGPPPVTYRLTQDGRTLPDVGFEIGNESETELVRAQVKIALAQGTRRCSIAYGHYDGEFVWNLNPRRMVGGHFRLPSAIRCDNAEPLRARIDVTLTDIHGRRHKLLPVGWIHGLNVGDQWYFEPSIEALDIPEESPPAPGALPADDSPHSAFPVTGRRFTNRTARELLALYEGQGRTALQADKLFAPYKGLWIEVSGELLQLLRDAHGFTVVSRSGPRGDLVNARCDKKWELELSRLNTGDTVKLCGRISDTQNGQQLYLLDCVYVWP
jgi:pyrimidine deaminase RibD-like protein